MRLPNAVRVATPSTGTGSPVTLGAALPGFLSPAAAGMVDGRRYSYLLRDGAARELAQGVYDAGAGTVTRVTLNSSEGGAALDLSGDAEVMFVLLGEDLLAWYVVAESGPAAAQAGYLVDTSGNAVTLTLPADPQAGDTVRFVDAASSFGSNALTIARNGKRIMGLLEDMTVSLTDARLTLVYSGDAALGWRLA